MQIISYNAGRLHEIMAIDLLHKLNRTNLIAITSNDLKTLALPICVYVKLMNGMYENVSGCYYFK